MITLPTSKVPAVSVNPRFLIIYGRPKSGKTSALAQLENNLIIDLEGGSTFIDAMAIQCRNISDLGEAAQAIRLVIICNSCTCTIHNFLILLSYNFLK